MRLDGLTIHESTSGVPKHEQQLLEVPGEQRHHLGQLSVPQATGAAAEVLPSLRTASVYAVETEGSTDGLAVEVQFDVKPLRGEGLLQLMEALAPVKLADHYDENRRAEVTLRRWILVGDQASGVQRDGSKAYEQQKSGLRGWAQLGQDHADLMAAIEPLHNSRPLPHEPNIVQPGQWEYGWAGGAESLSDNPLITTAELNQLLIEVYGEEGARTQIIGAMKHASRNPSGDAQAELEGLSDEELVEAFNTADIEQRNEFAGGNALQRRYDPDGLGSGWNASDEAVQRFQALYVERYTEVFSADDGGRLMYVHGLEPGEDIRQAYEARRKIFVGRDRDPDWSGDYCAAYECETMELNTIVGTRTVIVPGSIKYQELGLVPAVRWSVDQEGGRTLQELPEHSPFTSPNQYVPSTVAGLMVMASFQPRRYRAWHKQRLLPGNKYEEDMEPAYVPYIVKQNAGRLLDNRLTERAEQLVQSAA